MQTIELKDEVANHFLKQQHRIKLPDAIIASTAITYQIELLTLDKKLANKVKNSQ